MALSIFYSALFLRCRFLTQTRPDVSSPELYRPSPSQRLTQSQYMTQTHRRRLSDAASSTILSPAFSPSLTRTARQPLGTLSLETPDTEEERGRLRRLRRGRRDSSSEERREEESPSPSPSPSPYKRPLPGLAVRKETATGKEKERDVFGVLLAGAKSLGMGKGKDKMMREMNGPVGRSEFVMNEAEEEDDDEMLGWGGTLKRKVGGAGGDEEEEGEDDGKDLVGMMDERVIGEDEIAREKVVEKARCVAFSYSLLPLRSSLVLLRSLTFSIPLAEMKRARRTGRREDCESRA